MKGHNGLYKTPTKEERRARRRRLRGEGDKLKFIDLRFKKMAGCVIWERKKARFLPGWLSLFWSMAKVASQNFCKSSFPPLKKTLTLLLTLLYPRPIFLRQSLPPTPTWTTKGSNHITSPLQNSLCHPLSPPHEKSVKPFSSLTPPNPRALMVFQQ